MRKGLLPGSSAYSEQKRMVEGLQSSGSDLDRKYRVALVLYGVLALLVWFTVGEGKILVSGRPVELRLIPILIIGTFALRTVVAHKADKIRRDKGEGGS
jgi:hypothetical protein